MPISRQQRPLPRTVRGLRILIFKAGVLWTRAKCDDSRDRKTAKRVVHARQTKARKAERDGSVIGSWSRRLTPTKQNRPRPAENDPSTHNEIEKSVEKGRRRKQKGDSLRLGSRKYGDTKIERKTEPASEGTKDDGSCFGGCPRSSLLGDPIIPRRLREFLTDGR